MTHGSRSLWLRWGAVVAPVVMIGVFIAANRLSGPRPAAAEALASSGRSPHAPLTPEKEVVGVEMWILSRDENVNSPFVVGAVTSVVEDEPETQRPIVPVLEGVKLSGVFSANETTMASINGKLYRPGQEVRPGVKIASIDARARKVTLELADGREVELTAGRQTTQREVDQDQD